MTDDRLIDLVRHGETRDGARFRGRHDDPLTDTGWHRMTEALAGDAGWTAVIASPARRCADFARWFSARRGLPLYLLDDLGERAFGAWEGVPAERIPAEDLARFWADPVGFAPPGAESFAAFRDRVLGVWGQILDGTAVSGNANSCRHQDGTPMSETGDCAPSLDGAPRSGLAEERRHEDPGAEASRGGAPGASRGPRLLIVTHGGVIRVILAAVLRMPDAASLLIEVPPASRSRLRVPAAPGQPSLMFHGALR